VVDVVLITMPHRTLNTLLCLLLLAGPLRAAESPREFIDDRGRLVRIEKTPTRIVSLLPSITESLCALGACNRIIGTDRFSDFPAQVRSLPKLGDLDDLQWEQIRALKPDVVIASKSMRQIERLETLGLRVLAFDSQTHEDIRRSLRLLGTLLGDAQAGERLWQVIDQDIASARALLPDALKQASVYVEVGPSMHAAGPNSFLGQTVQLLGLRNVVAASMGPFPQLSTEWLLGVQPRWLVMQVDPSGQRPKRPGWTGLSALQQGRLCELAPGEFDVLVRPGPRLGEAAHLLVQCLSQAAQRAHEKKGRVTRSLDQQHG
jgi:iron complex transport system substrate-binding protein